MFRVIGQWAKYLVWAEPIGQLLVLLAVGLQLYRLEPAKTDILTDQLNQIKSAQCQLMETEPSIGAITIRDFGCHDPYPGAWTAERHRALYGPLYIVLFAVGGLAICIGKSASILDRKKSAATDLTRTPTP